VASGPCEACAVFVVGANDETIVEAVRQADKARIDCPLGWPVPFVEFVTVPQARQRELPPDLTSGQPQRSNAVAR